MTAKRFKTFGECLKYYREEKGFTQSELGQLVGYREELINHLEQSLRSPDRWYIYHKFFTDMGIEYSSDVGLEMEVLAEQAAQKREGIYQSNGAEPTIVVIAFAPCISNSQCLVGNAIAFAISIQCSPFIAHPAQGGKSMEGAGVHAMLSPRLIEVLRLKAEGMTDEEIAESMTVDLDTVKTYLRRIRAKLRVPTTLKAIHLWQQDRDCHRTKELSAICPLPCK